jgi:hypothetical protein
MSISDELKKELSANFVEFNSQLAELVQSHPGKFALMRQRKIVDYYDTAQDAFRTGQRLYPDGLFSVQEIASSPVDLGFYSHAVLGR